MRLVAAVLGALALAGAAQGAIPGWLAALAARSQALNERYGLGQVVADETPVAPETLAAPDGYYRLDLERATGMRVLCQTDAAWPSDLPKATGYVNRGASYITMRTWRCEGLVPASVHTELWARGLFVLAHERVHALGNENECDADKGAVAAMPAIASALGYPATEGAWAAAYLNELYRPNPLPDPYCLGRL